MNNIEADAWKCRVLDEVFEALAGSNELVEALVFKGARVLNLRPGGGRQSFDIDSNFLPTFVEAHLDRTLQREFLERELSRAIRRHFERQNPVQLELLKIKVTPHPFNKSHPRGWDAFEVRLNVNDRSRNVLGLPALDIDVAAPEELLEHSVSRLQVGEYEVNAYTLERIAGEKLRAFLSSLPSYRIKVKKPGEAIRVKDLYDLARIQRVRPIAEESFWQAVGREFQTACKSRYVDCANLGTFQEMWNVTQKSYTAATIPRDISFDEVTTILIAIVEFFERNGVTPFLFPLPASG
jgi:hypothetical protein